MAGCADVKMNHAAVGMSMADAQLIAWSRRVKEFNRIDAAMAETDVAGNSDGLQCDIQQYHAWQDRFAREMSRKCGVVTGHGI